MMPGLTLRRPVALQVIVTEEFKRELAAELQEAADVTRKRIEQLDTEARRFLAGLQHGDLGQAMNARRRLEAERRKQETLHGELLKQVGEVANLELGSEFPRGTLESLVEVKTKQPVAYGMAPVVLSGKLAVLKDDPTGVFYRLTDAAPVK